MSEEKLVPKLRFAGFNEEWKSFRLNEISERITRKNKSLETDRPLTISAQYGLVDQIEYFNKIVASKSLKGYYLLNKGEFAYNKSYSNGYPFGAVKRLDNYENGAISTLYICFSVNNNMNSELLKEYFETDKWYKEIYKIAVEGARNHGLLNIAVGDFFNTKHILPTNNKEQEKIAKFLIELNKKIELLEKKLKNYQDFKKYLMQQIFAQKLRFNFTDEWDYLDFNKIFKSVSTKKYQIKSAEIMDNGDFEVIDQGQDEIAGYFNDKNKLCYELPIIIYGDHTTFVKFRDKPFIVGADGVKLLLPKIDANLKYLFYALEYFNIKPEGYKRHFSIIKKINLPLPSLEEQNEISEMFGSVDKKIMYTQKQLKETKKFKKSLLQQMFIMLSIKFLISVRKSVASNTF